MGQRVPYELERQEIAIQQDAVFPIHLNKRVARFSRFFFHYIKSWLTPNTPLIHTLWNMYLKLIFGLKMMVKNGLQKSSEVWKIVFLRMQLKIKHSVFASFLPYKDVNIRYSINYKFSAPTYCFRALHAACIPQ